MIRLKSTRVLLLAATMGVLSIQPNPSAAAPPIGEDMGKCTATSFKKGMCACKDSACAQKIKPAMAKKNTGNANANSSGRRHSGH